MSTTAKFVSVFLLSLTPPGLGEAEFARADAALKWLMMKLRCVIGGNVLTPILTEVKWFDAF